MDTVGKNKGQLLGENKSKKGSSPVLSSWLPYESRAGRKTLPILKTQERGSGFDDLPNVAHVPLQVTGSY